MIEVFGFGVGAVVRVTVLLLGAAGLAALLHKRSAALRHALWAAAMVASLSIPLLSLTLASLGVANSVPVREFASATWTRIFGLDPRAQANDTRPISTTAPTAAATARLPFDIGGVFTSTPSDDSSTNRVREALLGFWLLGLALCLSRILRSSLAVARLRRSATEVSDERILVIWRQIERTSRSPKVLLVEADGVTAAGTAGIKRPTILLPRGAGEWDAIRIRATLAHEYAHIVRRDCLTQLVADIGVAVYWFNPIVWYARRRMSTERERACDDLVLSDGVRPERYASVLLQTVRGSLLQQNLRAPAVLSMARPSELETRLVSILDPSRSRGRMSSRATVATGSLVTATAVLISVAHLDAATIGPPTESGVIIAESVTSRAPSLTSKEPSLAASVARPHLDGAASRLDGVAPRLDVGAARLDGAAGRLDDVTPGRSQNPAEKGKGEPDTRGDSIAAPLSERVELSAEIWSAARNSAVLHGPDSVLARELYAQLSRSPSWEGDLVRDRSAWALSRQRTVSGVGNVLIDPLIESLGDRDWRIRAYAAWALAESGAQRAVPALVRLLGDPNWRMRAMAAHALDGIGDERAASAMAGAANDEAWQVRVSVVQFLGALHNAKYRSLLETALADRHVAVRGAASEALDNPLSHR